MLFVVGINFKHIQIIAMHPPLLTIYYLYSKFINFDKRNSTNHKAFGWLFRIVQRQTLPNTIHLTQENVFVVK